MPTIQMVFTPNAKMSMNGVNFEGKACEKHMQIFEREIGIVEQILNKADYYETPETYTRKVENDE